MKPNKRSNGSKILYVVFLVLLIAAYYYVNQSSAPVSAPVPPTPTPVVLSEVAPSVTIGNQTKTTGCVSDGILPDSACTPGEIDKAVSQSIVDGTICVSGYSGTARPPSSETNKIKVSQFEAYGIKGPMKDYELDHLISLELGGCADCVSNLWPEPYNIPMGARQKDKVENYLHKQVCSGAMTLAEAQKEISSDWTAVYYRVYGNNP